MDENLVGYLLGTLDPITHQRVEAHLRSHPEARERLALLKRALAPLAEDGDDPEPPPGLVADTLSRVAEQHQSLPAAPTPTPSQFDGASRRWLRRIDWAVAACLLVVVGGLLAPVVAQQRQRQQRLACENNLRTFWGALQAYADRGNDAFPQVEAEGPRAVAGIFVPVLNDCGLLEDVSIACPALGRQQPLPCSVKDLEQLYRDYPAAFRVVAGELSGHYAYSLGYQDGQALHGLRRDSGDGLPILADAAGAGNGAVNSRNHGGAGQNVLYVGGNVRWCVRPTVGVDCDNIYVNRDDRIGAGVCRSDTVLGASNTQP
jgi:hypothetical protein